MAEPSCFICGLESAEVERDPGRDVFFVNCRRCGRYYTTRRLTPSLMPVLMPYLSAYTRQASEKGLIPKLDIENWKAFAHRHQVTPVREKARKLLQAFADRSSNPSALVQFELEHDYPLVDAKDSAEMIYYADHLNNRGYLDKVIQRRGAVVPALESKLTLAGWEAVESLSTETEPDRCFIALWFDESMKETCEPGLKAGAQDAGYEAYPIRDVQFNGDIMNKIRVEIKRARFIIADFTGHRKGVYFEAGYALALGKEVIFTCRKDEVNDAHFDTSHFNHIVWSSHEDLREKLRDRIEATISRVGSNETHGI